MEVSSTCSSAEACGTVEVHQNRDLHLNVIIACEHIHTHRHIYTAKVLAVLYQEEKLPSSTLSWFE